MANASQKVRDMAAVSLPQDLLDQLSSIAEEENKSVARIIDDLLWIRKSEQLRRDGVFEEMKQVISEMREQAVLNGTSKMTMDEIDEEIAAARQDAAWAKIA